MSLPEFSQQNPLKIVVVGDGAIGKRRLLVTYTTGIFPTEYVPTVFDNFSSSITYKGSEVPIALWYTAGQDNRMRVLSYPYTDVFLLCYSIDNKNSYENIASFWRPEVRNFSTKVPIVLVATKCDLRNENATTADLVSTKDGKKMCAKIGAAKYVECSAKTSIGVEEVFQKAVRSVFKRKSRVCKIQ
uniref:Uncharacterized protein n=1 Tax=Strigamia maritima TaxID=126957 RepID=T1IS63_STRMM